MTARGEEHAARGDPGAARADWSRALTVPGLEDDMARVERAIARSVSGEAPLLDDVLNYVVTSGGKRMRSALTLCAAYLGGQPLGPKAAERAVKAAAAVEIVHAGSLCHDDIVDDADVRRGKMSAKCRWGSSVAVIGGDYLLACSAGLVAELGDRECAVLAEALAAICRGQMTEMAQVFDTSRLEDIYLDSIAGKTAALLVASCRLGALQGGVEPESMAALDAFAHNLGLVFQITDDILDLEQSAEVLGKPAFSDVMNGVYTLPVIRAMRERSELAELLGGPLDAKHAGEVRDIVDASGGLQYARQCADAHATAALEALAELRGYNAVVVDALRSLVQLVRDQVPAVADGNGGSATVPARRATSGQRVAEAS